MEWKEIFRGEIMETTYCAVYTRKSVDDGSLDRDFNSIEAQREAGEAYIASQKANGWVCLPDRYDDGGWSGGNMERPALKRLMGDIESGKVNTIVCYKIDRLSRSLVDFAELQTVFERHHTNFVSVTQEINTSTSSGRMMLNILMTFAQFEREVITERVRDAISGAKRRGKFCGGVQVLGYKHDTKERKLYIVEKEAKTVRILFEKYISLGSLKQVVHEANLLGLKTKEWTSATGKLHAAKPWDTGSLYRILSNPIYAGYVRHYKTNYEGEHEPIISRTDWEQVQAMMATHGTSAPRRHTAQLQPFTGLVKCGHCRRALTPTYTKRHGRKYCYYICQASSKNPDHVCPLKRIPSGDLEQAVLKQLSALFKTPSILRATLEAVRLKEETLKANYERDLEILQKQMAELKTNALTVETDFDEIKKVGERLTAIRRKLNLLREPVTQDEIIAALSDTAALWEFMFPGARNELAQMVIAGIEVFADKINLTLRVDGLKDLAEEMSVAGYFTAEHAPSDEALPEITQTVLENGAIQLSMQLESKKIEGHRCVVIPAPGAERLKQSAILRAVRNAQRWMEMLLNGEAKNVTHLAELLGKKTPYVTRILSLNGLAPDIVEAIYRGEEPDGLSLERLTRNLPDDWAEQRRLLWGLEKC